MKLSIVVPLMNEKDNIEPLILAVDKACKEDFKNYELILVDDGSTDETVLNARKFANTHTKIIVLNRNYGQSQAMAAGIEQTQGDIIVTIDGDMQNDPSDIPMMVKKLIDENWDIVAGRRAKRQDSIIKKIPSKVAHWLIGKLTGVIFSDGCTLKAFRKDVAKNLGLYGELHRFIPVLATMYGAKIVEVPVKHHARLHGTTKYGLGRTIKVVSDLLLMVFFKKYGLKPMHLFGSLGTIATIGGFGIASYLLILKILGQSIGTRPLFISAVLLIIAGIQLITTGFLAEILMRTYYESQNKKPYAIRNIFKKESENA